METRQPREQLALELRRHGLPRAYIERLLEELDDHAADLQNEREAIMHEATMPQTESDSRASGALPYHPRLGDPAHLAAVAARQYHNRSFFGRHPIFTFLFLPLPLILLLIAATFIATCLVGAGIVQLVLGSVADDPVADFNFYNSHPLLANLVFAGCAWVWIVVPPLLTALFVCRVVRRNGISFRWASAACVLVSLWAGLLFIQCTGPTRPGNGMLMIGLGVAPTSWRLLFGYFVPRFGIAFGTCLLLIKRAQRLQKIDETRDELIAIRRAA